eukprot:TRINITY_DN4049_c0_g1_i1.p1 TRINITY_DN4049_c0_g1~~TRINITY_DN4049_c0_g1_i1.p1  ORF type:complete len:189 (-),score=32.43 TRINITY_DN4049_c0_g1_i1:3-569(-)
MLAIGNEISNQKFRVPTSFKLLPDTPLKVRENYIRAKYTNSPFSMPTEGELQQAKASEQSSKSKGSTLVAKGILKIQLISGSNLPAKDLNGLSDPYCVFECGNQKAKSKVINNTVSPKWNETIMLNIPDVDKGVNVTVWDHDAIMSDDKMGSFFLDLKSLQPNIPVTRDVKVEKGYVKLELEYFPLNK